MFSSCFICIKLRNQKEYFSISNSGGIEFLTRSSRICQDEGETKTEQKFFRGFLPLSRIFPLSFLSSVLILPSFHPKIQRRGEIGHKFFPRTFIISLISSKERKREKKSQYLASIFLYQNIPSFREQSKIE